MIDASALHDALRAEGLVPEGEDVHLLACSTDYHLALNRVADDLDYPDEKELREELDEMQGDLETAESECAAAQAKLEETEGELAESEEELEETQTELEKALARVAELERALEAVEDIRGYQELKGSKE